MWTTDHRARSHADAPTLWRLLADVDGWGVWNDGIESITLDGPLVEGAVFRMTPPGEDVLTSTVVELQPGARLTDETVVGDVVVRVAHLLDPDPGGGTWVTYRVTVDGPVPDDVARQIGLAVSADFPDVIAALVALAEGGPGR